MIICSAHYIGAINLCQELERALTNIFLVIRVFVLKRLICIDGVVGSDTLSYLWGENKQDMLNMIR